MKLQLQFNVSDNYKFNKDNIKVESLTGSLLDRRPVDSTFYNGFNEGSLNANWGDGVLGGTGVGGASISDDKLDLSFNDIRYVDFAGVNNVSSGEAGCIRFKVFPSYTGTPSSTMVFVLLMGVSGNENNNLLKITHEASSGNLRLVIQNNSGAGIIDSSLGVWSPVAGNEYEIEINFNVSVGTSETRLFVNGVQFGATNISSGVRDSNVGLLRIGSDVAGTVKSFFKIDEIIVFSSVQHIQDYKVSEVQQPQTIYSTDNPFISPKMPIYISEMLSFVAAITETGADLVRFSFSVNGTDMWFDSSGWVESFGYSESNTISEITANISTFIFLDAQVIPKIYLHSADGSTSPDISSLVISFNFSDSSNTDPPRTFVSIRVVDIEGLPVNSAFISIRAVVPKTTKFLAGEQINIIVSEGAKIKNTDIDGRTVANLIRSSVYKGNETVKYELTATKEEIGYSVTMIFSVPDLLNVNLNVLVSPTV